jgi:hypothetical protein
MKKPDVVLTLSYDEAKAFVDYWYPMIEGDVSENVADGTCGQDKDNTYKICIALHEALGSE